MAPNPRKRTESFLPFKVGEIVWEADFLLPLFLVVLFAGILAMSSNLGEIGGTTPWERLQGFASASIQAGFVVSAAILGIVIVAATLMLSFTDKAVLYDAYNLDEYGFRQYVAILLLPAVLAVPTLGLTLGVDLSISVIAPIWPWVYYLTIVIDFLVLWQLTSLVQSIRQIQDGVLDGVKHYHQVQITKETQTPS
jgi:hypothetical protein